MIWRRTSPCPWKNLRTTAIYLNMCGSLILEMAPRPNVVDVSMKKPKMIAFLVPILFLIKALNGAKMIYATAKMDKIRETSVASNS